MIDDLKPYPAYKDSGVEWLGKVPGHWGVRKIKSLVSTVGGMTPNKGSEGFWGGTIPWVSPKDMKVREISDSIDHITALALRLTSISIIRPPAILIVVRGMILAKKFPVAVTSVPVTINQDMKALVPVSDLNPTYLAALLTGIQNYILELVEFAGHGTCCLRTDSWENLVIPLPPLSEQLAIVRFLDHADRLIKKYIRAKQKLIKLLEEQKQAIIHQAVTRGLDPNVKLKPSGVEWLGEVPEGWGVVRFKFVASRIVDCLHATPNYSESGTFPAIRTADISPGVVRLSSARRIEAGEYERWIERLEPKAGDILYSREGERFGIAACVPAGIRLCISQRMMVFRIRPDHNPEFVMWLLNNRQVYAQARQDVMGATAPHVNVSTIKNYAVALPCREEQDQLLQKISDLTDGFATVQANTARQISLLREYRTRLIADVVTGKLDVREAAAALPDVLEETEASADVDETADEELDGAESGEAEEAET